MAKPKMKKDFRKSFSKILSEKLDYLIEEKHRALFNTSCRFFSRVGKSQRPYCQKGNNKKAIGKTKNGQPYEIYLANCRDCREGLTNE